MESFAIKHFLLILQGFWKLKVVIWISCKALLYPKLFSLNPLTTKIKVVYDKRVVNGDEK